MATTQVSDFEAQAGTGPEYDYPTTDKDAAIPVIPDVEPQSEEGAGEDVPGEDAKELTDEEIAKEEELELKELGGQEWSEDLAQNTRQPGEAPDLLPEERRLPSDIGG